jgi:hypothetical protein
MIRVINFLANHLGFDASVLMTVSSSYVLASGDSTMVEHLPHHHKVKGLNPAATAAHPHNIVVVLNSISF